MKVVLGITSVVLVIGFWGCTGTVKEKKVAVRPEVPAGVDSLIAAFADSMADQLFVSWDRKVKARNLTAAAKQNVNIADSLWETLKAKVDSTRLKISTTPADSGHQSGARTQQTKPNEQIKQAKKDSLTRAVVRDLIFALLDNAKDTFENSLNLDPFNLDTRFWLAHAYNRLGEIFAKPENFKHAIRMLKNLIAIEKGEHGLYDRLGFNYYQLKNWPEAYENFKKAEEVLLATAFSETGSSTTQVVDSSQSVIDSVDTRALLSYVYYQADTKAKLYDDTTALALLERALEIAPTPDDQKVIKTYIDWINWDDGNIWASEMKDSMNALQLAGKYEEAKSGLIELLPHLKTQKAKDYTIWRISLMEYYQLKEEEQGAGRLLEVVRRIPVDSALGVPVDTTHRKYVRDCGEMYYNLGQEYKRKADYKKARMYFNTGASFEWSGRGSCLLELAKLSIHQPREAIRLVDQALNPRYKFKNREQIEALTLKLRAYRRLGPKYMGKVKDIFKQIRQLQLQKKGVG